MIIFNSAQGKYELQNDNSDETMIEFLKRKRIPYNAISLYGQQSTGNNLKLVVGLNKTLAELNSKYDNIIVQPDRNIDFQSLLQRPLEIIKNETQDYVGEYVLDSLNKGQNSVLKKFSLDESKKFVNTAVGDVLAETKIDFGKKIVFGISGGGDSNTLLEAFIANGFPKDNLIPVMIHGIPDMDQGTLRAREISREQGLKLIELSSKDVDRILGRVNQDGTWASDYEDLFNDDLESIATLVIRLGLAEVAKEYDAQAIVTGLNLEDILAESIAMVSKGYAPAKYPERIIDDTRIIYPLYRVPKKIIDATHPKYSLENYIQRFPSRSHWRAVSYYFAQSISTILPGMEFRLIDGFKKIAANAELPYRKDPSIGLPVLGEIDEKTENLWNQFINN